MAVDYVQVLAGLGVEVQVIGRGEESANIFYEKTGILPITGGLGSVDLTVLSQYEAAIIAVGIEQLAECTMMLMKAGVRKILSEKPGAISEKELLDLNQTAIALGVELFIGYNRRFYQSVIEAKRLIEEDDGVTSFNFEFTEWSHKIEPLQKNEGVKENWFLGNSTHVVDMAFYLGGRPVEMYSYSNGQLSWHEKSNFAGAGTSENSALFNYQANWESAGRWCIDILTKKNRYIFKPLESLQIQKKGTIHVEHLELSEELDKAYKPGLYKQVESFITGENHGLKTIAEQLKDWYLYRTILQGGSYKNESNWKTVK